MAPSHFLTLSLLFLSIQTCFFISQSTVPVSNTFTYVNEGEFGLYIVEYDANYRTLPITTAPFQLCFYNTTPNAYTLALRMGLARTESLFRWVWEANRGDPVRENATLSFGTNGNLALTDSDGRIVWQTGTTNKGVVGFSLLSNGNMVLRDSKGKIVWQSFDYPTDTLLVGQSLRVGSATNLVSRVSGKVNANGLYSLVMESNNLALYYKSKNSPTPLLYFNASDWFFTNGNNLSTITFNVEPLTFGVYAYYNLLINYDVTNSTDTGHTILASPKYNSTLSFLRIDIDGNIRIYTFYDRVDYGAWEVTYTLFSRVSDNGGECQLPERCGGFGLCEDSQCVACPKPNGLLGWSRDCVAPKVKSCGVNDFYYYKVEGVDHFLSRYTSGIGPIRENACGDKCSKDSKCLGYFYHRETSMCWIAYELKTLTKVANSNNLGYIKAPKSSK